ncbi:hypothetical protein [Streptomyces abikoensis]|uniref:Uncharacterized protein n=1 Tax=Streptomyces abikoensis TaxID=97398 RepID=A0ABW7TG16_9ACTN
MAGKRITNPAGSTNDLRGDVLRVLGVLKVATADQIQRICAPHLSYRHTTKPTPSEQKTARTASHTGALSDMRKHGLAENGGTTKAGERLRNLTTKGLEAASLLLVFNHIGARDPNRTVPRLIELTRHLWQGERQKGGHHHYDGRIPIIATGLRNLRQHGPAGPAFLRFGRDHMQPLLEAIGNPRREAADAQEREAARLAQEEYKAQVRRTAEQQAAKKAAEREARRPVCAGCGVKFTDERWEVARATDWGTSKDTHPQLCDDCKHQAVLAARQDQVDNERREQDRAVPEQKVGGWLSRLRS